MAHTPDDTDPRAVTGSAIPRRQFLGAGLGLAGGALASRAFRRRDAITSQLLARAREIKPRGSGLEAIEHVVVVMQENRSFDYYFGTYPAVRGFDDHPKNSPGVFAQAWPADATHTTAGTLLPYRIDSATLSPQCAGSASVPIHNWGPQHTSWANGKMTGFVSTHTGKTADGAEQGPLVMAHFVRDDIPFYFSLADAFTLCDGYHSSVIGPTMPNRLYSLSAFIDPAGQFGGPVVQTPPTTVASGKAIGSVHWETMFERLSDHKVSWKVYQTPGTSVGPAQSSNLSLEFNALLYFEQYVSNPASQLYQNAFLPVWPDEFVSDVLSDTLPQVSWMMPELVQSEHASASPSNGEAFVRQIVQALLGNPAVWAKTVVFVVYDENGGFFDHVAPKTAPPGTPGEELTVDPLPDAAAGIKGPIGLGFRVPAIVVSPFARGGYVNSDTLDHTSILRFLETRFGVPVPNLTDWRRQAVGDMTSTLDLTHSDTSVPRLPPAGPGKTEKPLLEQCPDTNSVIGFIEAPPLISVPAKQQLPRQEKGSRKRR